jgi:imidazolonepropionase-like amidohydrolase
VLPGLVDAHCHIGMRPASLVESIDEVRSLALIDRDSGVLTIRDAGSPIEYGDALDDDPDLPRLVRAGRHIAAPKRYMRDIGVEVSASELLDEVRRQAAAGNGWVKLVGDWIDRSVGDLAPSWSTDVMADAVAVAHEAGARVAVHTFGEESVAALVRAGVDSVEHGTGLADSDISVMAEAGTALVPTMLNIATFGSIASQAREKFPTYADHMIALRDRLPAVVRSAHEAGVPIYVGTDAGGSLPHGLVAQEMVELTKAGLSNAEVVAAATWGAREWLGRPGIVEGEDADLVVYAADPLADVTVVGDPQGVVLRGRVVV